MEHLTGIKIECTRKQKNALIELLSESLKLGRLSPKDHVKELLENQIIWEIK